VDPVLKEALLIIGGVLVCGGFWAFIQFLINRNDNKKSAMKDLQEAIKKLQESQDKNNTNMLLQNEALMSIAQDRIVWLGEQYIKQGFIYTSDASSLIRMANAYKALGGNDLVTETMEQVTKLPRKVKK